MTALFAASASAEPLIVDNPGLCTANDGEQELADMAVLDSTGIHSHALSCTWEPALKYTPGFKAQVEAKCDGHDGPFSLTVDVSVNSRWRIAVTGYNGSTFLPDFYFPCAHWGFKG